ncbi:MAG: NTP transferase domain-containing protein [Hyphomicrobiales bacterium]
MPENKRLSVAAVLLAAGRSRRFGEDNKLLADVGGEPMIRKVAREIAGSRAAPLLVVTGHDADRIEGALAGIPAMFVPCPDHRLGLSASLGCGIAAVPPDIDGALVCLGDMPGVTARIVDRVIGMFSARGGQHIVHPRRPGGGPGHPVAWPRDLFPELMALGGDQGGRDLIARHAPRVTMVDGGSREALADIDTAEALDDWRAGKREA